MGGQHSVRLLPELVPVLLVSIFPNVCFPSAAPGVPHPRVPCGLHSHPSLLPADFGSFHAAFCSRQSLSALWLSSNSLLPRTKVPGLQTASSPEEWKGDICHSSLASFFPYGRFLHDLSTILFLLSNHALRCSLFCCQIPTPVPTGIQLFDASSQIQKSYFHILCLFRLPNMRSLRVLGELPL